MHKQKTKNVKLTTNQTVRIPSEIIREMGLERDCNFEVKATDDGIMLIPLVQIPKSQEYYWTKEWQEKEREVDEEVKAGREKIFDNVDDLIEDLLS